MSNMQLHPRRLATSKQLWSMAKAYITASLISHLHVSDIISGTMCYTGTLSATQTVTSGTKGGIKTSSHNGSHFKSGNFYMETLNVLKG